MACLAVQDFVELCMGATMRQLLGPVRAWTVFTV